MADFRLDQAAGLRRLMSPHPLRVVTFASGAPDAGKTTIVANVAAALAKQGQEVLVVDENAPSDLGAFFGLQATGDLLQVVNAQRTLDAVLFSPCPGLTVLPAGQAARQLGQFSARQRQALEDALHRLTPDVILVDANLDREQCFSPWGLSADEVVMVVSASGAAITEAYALIKKISQSFSRRRFRILVNRARQIAEGQRIFENLKTVAATHGVAHLDYVGALPLDVNVKQVGLLATPIVDALPEAPAAAALKTFASRLAQWPNECPAESSGVERFVKHLLDFCGERSARLPRGFSSPTPNLAGLSGIG